MTGWIGAVWGLGGLAASIANAVIRLAPTGWTAFDVMEAVHWAALAVWVPAMVIGEGYFGFHRSFS
ncbi:MAG: hypothetical protein R3266_01340, partial [Gemmatimonadota bacterium]|nr:hypothetical protein [Gemmatimonadota bacterium]